MWMNIEQAKTENENEEVDGRGSERRDEDGIWNNKFIHIALICRRLLSHSLTSWFDCSH